MQGFYCGKPSKMMKADKGVLQGASSIVNIKP